jgi:hypothetical protein
MKTYIVLVDALGFNGGCARKGEQVTSEQIGTENVERLVVQGFILDETPVSNAAAPQDAPEPETLASRLAVGLLPDAGKELTDDEAAWVRDVKAGVLPVPFDSDKVASQTIKVIKDRIVAFGVEPLADGRKADYVTQLQEVVVSYFENWDVSDEEDDGA